MRFSIDSKVLAQAAKQVAAAAEPRASIAVLSCIHVTADSGGAVKLLAGDLDTFLETTVDADVKETGVLCVPARLFASAAAAAATGTVTVEVDGDDMLLAGDGFDAALRGVDASEYPRVDWGDGVPVAMGETWPLVTGVAYAASEDQARPILTGIHFDGTVVEATDSYRAARAAIPDVGGEALVPGAAVRYADRLLDASVIAMAVSKYAVRFEDGATRIVGRLIEGSYPNVGPLFPTTFEHELTVDAQALRDAVAAVEFVDSGLHRAVRLLLEGETLTVSRRDQIEYALAERTVEAAGSLPGPIGVSAPYLRDALDGADGDVTLKLTDGKKPILVTGVPGVDQIVMPVRLP